MLKEIGFKSSIRERKEVGKLNEKRRIKKEKKRKKRNENEGEGREKREHYRG